MIDSIIRDEPYVDQTDRFLTVGKDVLLQLSKDNTDRNRTSPVAFTGNKFEFRMPGSSQSIAMPVTYLNTILAQELKECADRLEGAEDRPQALRSLIREMLSEHRRILFNGNGYDQSWIAEAERRGLKNLRNTAETIPEFVNEKNVRLLTENGIYSLKEIESRNEIHLESYCGTTVIEARTLLEMIRKGIFGAVSAFLSSLGGDFYFEKELTKKAGSLGNDLLQAAEDLEEALAEYDAAADPEARLKIASEKLTARMAECRRIADLLEKIIDARFWPYPNYTQLMFTI